MTTRTDPFTRGMTRVIENPGWRRLRPYTTVGVRRVLPGVPTAAALACVAAVPMAMAQLAADGTGQWVAASAALFVAFFLLIGQGASWLSLSDVKDRQLRRRAMLARTWWIVTACGVRMPADRRWYRPRLLASTGVVVGTCLALSRAEVLNFVARHESGPATSAQVADGAQRALWWSAGLPGHIPGSALLSGVVTEELLFRGTLLVVVAAAWAIPRNGRRGRRAVVAGVVVLAWLASTWSFGYSHANFSDFNVTTGLMTGAVWGATAIWTRSLVPAVIGHVLWNLIATGVI